jgi:hypothetical protein
MNKNIKIIFFFTLLATSFFGCKKQSDINAVNTLSQQDSLVFTPFGPISRKYVHQIEDGYHLRYLGDHLLKIETSTGKTIEDFGVQTQVHSISGFHNLSRLNRQDEQANQNTIVPGLGQGWITYAQNNNTLAVSTFSTFWTVPTAPSTNDGQLLYLFNGLQDGVLPTSHILQPVLQYGSNNAFGGNYWVINNWYASCSTCQAYYATPVGTATGTTLNGVMKEIGQSGSTYSYTSSFVGAPANNTFQVDNVPQLIYSFETMESYKMQTYSDYPQDLLCQMFGIQILVGSTNASLNWIPYNEVTDVGQHTNVVSNNSPGGEVDLYFHSSLAAPEINNSTSLLILSSGAPYKNAMVTATPGSKVYLGVYAMGKAPIVSTQNFTITTPGVLFNTGAANVTVTQGTKSVSFVMPASGYIEGYANYSQTGNSSEPIASGNVSVHY